MPDRRWLNPVEQHHILSEITLHLLPVLPTGWRQVLIDYAALGTRVRARSGVRMGGGRMERLAVPSEIRPLFLRLREGMYREGTGTWFAMRYAINPPDVFSAEYDYTALPDLLTPVPTEALTEEQRRLPRTPKHMPDWFQAGLGAPPEQARQD
ncbi:hypothetical protein LG943_20415 [Streptomonospora sp. S1-112]|uniref:Uncharacterized protein n=1 Tax=Streptomonospora mangrovi TaxID=2883123 RepID=A0A9X3NQY4_9ACTN|nr:hypothetical protein [Streptomonospora mangrovi]MDA0566656.1 hypothetical protein [Streptomonospora mangrovi]